MNDELAPCPFCGSTHVELVCSGSTWFVRCNECDATGPGVTDGEDNDTGKAAAAWAISHAGDERRHVVCMCPDCMANKPQNVKSEKICRLEREVATWRDRATKAEAEAAERRCAMEFAERLRLTPNG